MFLIRGCYIRVCENLSFRSSMTKEYQHERDDMLVYDSMQLDYIPNEFCPNYLKVY